MRVSRYYGLNIYNTKGEYVGIVNDIILDFDTGYLFGLAVGQETGVRNIAVKYTDVSAVADIILVRAKPEE
ncbi:MAG: PRC-barrel domain-containing protein [Candidatus Methanofastidiosia archaeon]